MPKRFKVAVIGAGDMGSEHVKGWTLAGHEVLSVADIDLDRARALAATYDVPHAYADYQVSVADPAVDIVSICTPLAWHAPVTIAAAAQGKTRVLRKAPGAVVCGGDGNGKVPGESGDAVWAWLPAQSGRRGRLAAPVGTGGPLWPSLSVHL